jgi:ectoine hydroxylase-related dioxygenase (phytanoyl-CoA dioxygenase family)
MTNYEFDKYESTIDNFQCTLEKYGVAIIPNLLSEEECKNMNKGMWGTLKRLTKDWEVPIKISDKNSWKELKKLYPKHSMLIQNWSVGHAQYVWDVRQNEKIVDVFTKIWNCEKEELLVSFDAVSYHMPPEVTKSGWFRNNLWYHCDQSFSNNTFSCVQGWVNALDTNEGDATLAVLEKSHLFHKDFSDKFQVKIKDDWYKLESSEQLNFYLEKGCEEKRIKCPKGSLVLWDSRTIHCGVESEKNRTRANVRNVVYVCYEPRSHCTNKNLEKKVKAFEEMRLTSHWPCKVKLFPKAPRTYGGPIYEVGELPKPILNELGKKLAGY